MTTQTILEQAGIPLLLFVICMYYGLKLMILQDVSRTLTDSDADAAVSDALTALGRDCAARLRG